MLRKIAIVQLSAAMIAFAAIAEEPTTTEQTSEAVCGLSADSARTLITMVEELKLPESPAPDGYKAWQDNPNRIVWSVTMPSHPAHPSAVCRKVIQDNLRVDVLMELRCDGEQKACDTLVGEFQIMTDQMRRNVQIRY
jgi:hypothetical protein